MKEQFARLNLRVPVHLRDWILERATKTRRSCNSEFVVAIEAYRAGVLANDAAPAVREPGQA